MSHLISSIGNSDFGVSAFGFVKQAVCADHIVVNLIQGSKIDGVFTDGLLSVRIAKTLNQRYIERYHLLDRGLQYPMSFGRGVVMATQFDPQLNASPAYNAFFFERANLCDKISIISNRTDGTVSCNLYRLASSGKFDTLEFQHVQALALPLTAAIWQHIEKIGLLTPLQNKSLRCSDETERLALRSLSPREMQVCQRLLIGASNEGVALDMGITTHTVRSLRKRIYKKLQINSLNDLFSKYMYAMSSIISSGQ
jgi:DNA-binding CsgD family transcriptional regulator